MTPSPPRIVTSRFITYEDDASQQTASLVVIPLDDVRNQAPAAPLRVVLKEQPRRAAVTNASGHFVFVDVPDGTYTLIVEPDRVNADWYFLRPIAGEAWGTGFERQVTLPKASAKEPVEIVTLTPKPGYPFAPAATLLLGRVTTGAAADPARLAVVRTAYERTKKGNPDETETVALETATDAHGYFVMFFHSLPEPKQPVEVEAALGGSSSSATVEIQEGKTTSTAIVLP
jgi:hypothetical protein